MIVIKKEKSDSSKESSAAEGDAAAEEQGEVPDLRVAVVTDRSPSPDDSKEDVWRSGQVKSVLRGARAHDSRSCDGSDGDDDDDDRRVRSSVRKHRSRSRERHHRSRRRKESSRKHHSRSSSAVLLSDRRRHHHTGGRGDFNEEYDSDEVTMQPDAQDLRAKISKKKKSDRHYKSKSRRDYSPVDGAGGDYNRSSGSKNNNKSSSFRPKSPLQIEIDNDEYYKLIESD